MNKEGVYLPTRGAFAAIARGELLRVPAWASYPLGVAIFGIGFLVRWLILPLDAGLPFVTFYPTLIAAAVLLGPGPGLLVLLLTGECAHYVLLPPRWSFILDAGHGLALFTYYLSGGAICLLIHSLRRHAQALAASRETAARVLAEVEDLYNHAPIGYHSLGPDGVFLRINDTELGWLGYARDELVGRMRALDLLSPASRESFLVNFPRLLEGQNLVDLRLDMICKDGRILPVLVNATALRDERGAFLMSRTTVHDLTERLHIESQLQEAQRIAHLGSWEVDLVNDQLVWSEEMYRLYEPVSPLPVTRQTCCENVLTEDLEATAAAFAAAVANRTRLDITHRVRPRDGGIRHVRVQGEVTHAADGRPLRAAGTAQDVTAAVHQEQALRESEARYRQVVEGQTELICRFRADGTILFVNNAYTRFFGRQPAELIGQKWQPVAHPDDVPYIEEQLHRMTAASPLVTIENRVYSASGEIRWMQFINQGFFDDAGQLLEVQCVGRDITERKRLEAELERHRLHLEDMVEERTVALSVAKEAAEAANRAKTTFLAKMSHELRTPLTGIMGMTDLAMRRATDLQQRAQLDKVRRSSLHLLAVINDVLDLSKIEAERLTLEERDFKLAEVLENVLDLIEGKARERNLELRVDIAEHLRNRPLHGDPLRLAQVLLNIVGNAVKFTRQGGVTVRAMEENETVPAGLLRFEISDTGIGIAPADCLRLFSAFEQADNSTAREFGGSGLGLAISKRLVHMMGGEIGLTSRPGVGSTFWFTIRLGRGDAQATPESPQGEGDAERALRQRHGGRRILLVEDEPINQEVAGALLEEVGLAVDVAPNGERALAAVAAEDYDLILMDMQMPVMDGLTAARAIRQSGKAAVPILAMTANAFADDRDKCLAAGMNDFITKPVMPERLFEMVLAWLERRTAG